MSGSFESIRCVHRLDLGLYSHLKKNIWGLESEPTLTPREKSLYGKNAPQRRIEPMTLHQAGQRAQHTTKELFQPLLSGLVVRHLSLQQQTGGSILSFPQFQFLLKMASQRLERPICAPPHLSAVSPRFPSNSANVDRSSSLVVCWAHCHA